MGSELEGSVLGCSLALAAWRSVSWPTSTSWKHFTSPRNNIKRTKTKRTNQTIKPWNTKSDLQKHQNRKAQASDLQNQEADPTSESVLYEAIRRVVHHLQWPMWLWDLWWSPAKCQESNGKIAMSGCLGHMFLEQARISRDERCTQFWLKRFVLGSY